MRVAYICKDVCCVYMLSFPGCFYSRGQRTERTCLHVHLATAARVKYPAALLRYKFDAPQLAAEFLTWNCYD